MKSNEINQFILEGEEDFFIESAKKAEIEEEYRLALLNLKLDNDFN